MPGSLSTVISVGQMSIVGGVVSAGPVTSKLHVAVFPDKSVIKKVLVVTPGGKPAPEGSPAVCSIPPVISRI